MLLAYGTQTIEELHSKLTDAQNKAGTILREWLNLQEATPALPSAEDDNPETLDNLYVSLIERVKELDTESERLHNEIREKELQLARLQGQTHLSIAAAQIKLQELMQEHKRLNREARALELASKELSKSIEVFSSAYRQELSQKAGDYFRRLTGVKERNVMLDEQFSVTLSEDGKNAAIAQLSQGAREQLYIALRLAVADLLAGEVTLPFIFDDPFVNWDEERVDRIRETLQDIAQQRQVLLFSHSQELLEWGQAITPTYGGTA